MESGRSTGTSWSGSTRCPTARQSHWGKSSSMGASRFTITRDSARKEPSDASTRLEGANGEGAVGESEYRADGPDAPLPAGRWPRETGGSAVTSYDIEL